MLLIANEKLMYPTAILPYKKHKDVINQSIITRINPAILQILPRMFKIVTKTLNIPHHSFMTNLGINPDIGAGASLIAYYITFVKNCQLHKKYRPVKGGFLLFSSVFYIFNISPTKTIINRNLYHRQTRNGHYKRINVFIRQIRIYI